jgi:transposase
MSNLSETDKNRLLQNPNVLKVSGSYVTYTPVFKLKAIKLHFAGTPTRQIFVEAGIDLSLFHEEYSKFTLKRWKKAFKKLGNKAFDTKQRVKKASKQPNPKFVTQQDEINYLKSELDLLKKIQALAKTTSRK